MELHAKYWNKIEVACSKAADRVMALIKLVYEYAVVYMHKKNLHEYNKSGEWQYNNVIVKSIVFVLVIRECYYSIIFGSCSFSK